MEGFCKWFRHNQNDIDFIVNIVLMVYARWGMDLIQEFGG